MARRTSDAVPLPGMTGPPSASGGRRGRLQRAADQVIRESRRDGAPYAVDDLTAAMLRTAAANVERAIAEGSSWAVANAMKELRAVRDAVTAATGGPSDAFDALLADLAADVGAPAVPVDPATG